MGNGADAQQRATQAFFVELAEQSPKLLKVFQGEASRSLRRMSSSRYH